MDADSLAEQNDYLDIWMLREKLEIESSVEMS